MKTISKALVTVAAGAMVMTSASPAFARDRDRDDGISAGDVIAGALIIGGIAAVAAAVGNDNDDRYDGRYEGRDDGRYDDRDSYERRGYGDDYSYGYRAGNSRRAVEQCVLAAERGASRYSYGGRADVTDIRSISRQRDGFTVRGRIAVNQMNRGWRNGDRNYGRGWDGDYRGWKSNNRGWDSGTFTCKVRYGRVVDLDYRGIRGLS